ncbi:MAG: hypothetical protein AAGF11_36085 [Myxococcota bacterium]
MDQAEQQRANEDLMASARSYAAAYRSLSERDRIGLLGELAVDNAATDYRAAYRKQPRGLALLEESAQLLEGFVAQRQRAQGKGEEGAVPPRLRRELERLRRQIDQALPDDGPVRVTVDSEVEYAGLLPLWIMRRNASLGPSITAPGHERWVEVQIERADAGVRIRAIAMRDGQPVGEQAEPLLCACGQQELLDRVSHEIARAIEGLPDEPTPEVETTDLDSHSSWTEEDQARTRRLGIALTASGAAAIVGGVTMTAVGGVLLPRFEPSPEFGFYEVTKHPGAPVLLGIGVSVVVAGLVPSIVGICALRNALRGEGCGRERQTREHALIEPWMGRGLAGASLRRRF